jgi:hypothetical protein
MQAVFAIPVRACIHRTWPLTLRRQPAARHRRAPSDHATNAAAVGDAGFDGDKCMSRGHKIIYQASRAQLRVAPRVSESPILPVRVRCC